MQDNALPSASISVEMENPEQKNVCALVVQSFETGQSLLGIGQNLRRLADSSPTLSAAGEPAQTTIGMGIAKMK